MLKSCVLIITCMSVLSISLLSMQPEHRPSKLGRPKSAEYGPKITIDYEKLGIITKHGSDYTDVAYRTIHNQKEVLSAVREDGTYTAKLGLKTIGGKEASDIFNILEAKYKQAKTARKEQ